MPVVRKRVEGHVDRAIRREVRLATSILDERHALALDPSASKEARVLLRASPTGARSVSVDVGTAASTRAHSARVASLTLRKLLSEPKAMWPRDRAGSGPTGSSRGERVVAPERVGEPQRVAPRRRRRRAPGGRGTGRSRGNPWSRGPVVPGYASQHTWTGAGLRAKTSSLAAFHVHRQVDEDVDPVVADAIRQGGVVHAGDGVRPVGVAQQAIGSSRRGGRHPSSRRSRSARDRGASAVAT